MRYAAAAATLLLAACSATPEAPTTEAPTSAQRETLITRTGVVQTVDLQTRQVLIRGESGRMLSLTAGPEVRNLAQLESGDVVQLDYYEAVAARMADSASPAMTETTVASERAPEGAKPGAAAASVVRTVVIFQSYDPASQLATFLMEDGSVGVARVKPEMQAFAAARQPGDRIDLTLVEAIAVRIRETG